MTTDASTVSLSSPSAASRGDATLESTAESGAPSAVWRTFAAEGFRDPLLELIAERFRLLGEPLRLKILAALIQGEQRVSDLVTITGAGQPSVSKHLNALAQGGLVLRRKAGVNVYYTVADPTIATLCDVVCLGVQTHIQAQADAVGVARPQTKSARQDGSPHGLP